VIGPDKTLMAGGTITMMGACAFAVWLPRLRAESRSEKEEREREEQERAKDGAVGEAVSVDGGQAL
jgi:hypothetical protein